MAVPALAVEQKTAQLKHYLDNVNQETGMVGYLGKQLITEVVDYIGHNNFFRIHRNIKAGSNYRSVPALRDNAKISEFIEENAFLIKVWFTSLVTSSGSLITEGVVTARINDGTLVGSPYPLEDVKAVINGGFNATGDKRGAKVPANAAEIKAWFDGFVLDRTIDLISSQAKLAILGVANSDYPRQLIAQAIFKGDNTSHQYDDLASDIMKTMILLITESFTNYLDKANAQV